VKQPPIRLDLPGRTISLDAAIVKELRDAAAAAAGRSSPARDLSLLLERALRQGTLTLRRAELETLINLARQRGLDLTAERLSSPQQPLTSQPDTTLSAPPKHEPAP
jgi:hypothetical protein